MVLDRVIFSRTVGLDTCKDACREYICKIADVLADTREITQLLPMPTGRHLALRMLPMSKGISLGLLMALPSTKSSVLDL